MLKIILAFWDVCIKAWNIKYEIWDVCFKAWNMKYEIWDVCNKKIFAWNIVCIKQCFKLIST